jgi:hypothetical protein
VSAWASVSATVEGSDGEPDRADLSASHDAPAEVQVLKEKLDRLAAIAARQQADLSASQWRLEQSEAENEALRGSATENESLQAELVALRARLQEAEVLMAQMRWREATTSDLGPAR